MASLNIKQVIRDAADLIENGHWIKGDYVETKEDGTQCFCAMGAIYKCAGAVNAKGYLTETKLEEVNQQINALMPPARRNFYPSYNTSDTIVKYNDTPRRQRRSVVKYLRELAASVST